MKFLFPGLIIILGLSAVFLIQNPTVIKKIPQLTQELTQPDKDLLLPDLFIETPRNVYIYGSGKNKKLRFTSSYGNKGKGPLELVGNSDPETKLTLATQNIKKTDGTVISREVGQFIFHPQHNHWHVDNYVQYQLWSMKEGKSDQLVATTNKQSVCLWDQKAHDLSLPGAPQKRFYPFPCDKVIQGFSVGWGDTYNSNIAGQEIAIIDIVDGDYLLKNVVNPDNKISEMTDANNVAEVKINISKNRVRIIE